MKESDPPETPHTPIPREHEPCDLTPLEWARERWANSVRIARGKTGADLEGWIEDVNYWAAIVGQLSSHAVLVEQVETLKNDRERLIADELEREGNRIYNAITAHFDHQKIRYEHPEGEDSADPADWIRHLIDQVRHEQIDRAEAAESQQVALVEALQQVLVECYDDGHSKTDALDDACQRRGQVIRCGICEVLINVRAALQQAGVRP